MTSGDTSFRAHIPQVADDSGYVVTPDDLQFLGITTSAFESWHERALPLGQSRITYGAFVANFWQAIRDDGIDPKQVDARLKGSSATFFASIHKRIPRNRDELVFEFRRLRNRYPEVFELEEIERRLSSQWPHPARPVRRPFDAMHKLSLDRVPSDYDLQISSDQIVERCESVARATGVSVTREHTMHGSYDFIRKDLLRASMKNLSDFAILMSEALGRDVSLAVFPSPGPDDKSAEIGDGSSHFRDSDWIIPQENP